MGNNTSAADKRNREIDIRIYNEVVWEMEKAEEEERKRNSPSFPRLVFYWFQCVFAIAEGLIRWIWHALLILMMSPFMIFPQLRDPDGCLVENFAHHWNIAAMYYSNTSLLFISVVRPWDAVWLYDSYVDLERPPRAIRATRGRNCCDQCFQECLYSCTNCCDDLLAKICDPLQFLKNCCDQCFQECLYSCTNCCDDLLAKICDPLQFLKNCCDQCFQECLYSCTNCCDDLLAKISKLMRRAGQRLIRSMYCLFSGPLHASHPSVCLGPCCRARHLPACRKMCNCWRKKPPAAAGRQSEVGQEEKKENDIEAAEGLQGPTEGKAGGGAPPIPSTHHGATDTQGVDWAWCRCCPCCVEPYFPREDGCCYEDLNMRMARWVAEYQRVTDQRTAEFYREVLRCENYQEYVTRRRKELREADLQAAEANADNVTVTPGVPSAPPAAPGSTYYQAGDGDNGKNQIPVAQVIGVEERGYQVLVPSANAEELGSAQENPPKERKKDKVKKGMGRLFGWQ